MIENGEIPEVQIEDEESPQKSYFEDSYDQKMLATKNNFRVSHIPISDREDDDENHEEQEIVDDDFDTFVAYGR
jgi:hypothetical protein